MYLSDIRFMLQKTLHHIIYTTVFFFLSKINVGLDDGDALSLEISYAIYIHVFIIVAYEI